MQVSPFCVFQLFCMLEDFCNKQLKKIAWKENRWRSPDPLNTGVATGGSSGVWEGKAVKLPGLKGATGRWESASRDCSAWAQVSTVSGQGQDATWELSPEFSWCLPVLMSPFCCTHFPQMKACHQQAPPCSHTGSSSNSAHPCLSIFLSPRDLPNEKNPFCNGSGHS